jgi:prepilin-type processing-associated H-X9-DG protein
MIPSRRATTSGLALPQLLVPLAIVLVLAAIVVLAFSRHAGNGHHTVQCVSNLSFIYAYAVSYADRSSNRRFPMAPGERRAHEALNEVIAFDPESLWPRQFVCEASDSVPEERGEDGRFLLRESTSSYAWTATPLEVDGPPRPLASDKYVDGFEDAAGRHSGHRGGMNVLYTDGSVRFVHEADLDPVSGLPPGLVR